jgi:D12 class N6 adenine-specific DNA methyltransferase
MSIPTMAARRAACGADFHAEASWPAGAAGSVARIAAVPHRTYAEPFVGMGGIFFRRRGRPKAEVINDRNGEVANLFRILQRHYPQFIDTLRYQITSRREFERLKASDPATLTDLERAGRCAARPSASILDRRAAST